MSEGKPELVSYAEHVSELYRHFVLGYYQGLKSEGKELPNPETPEGQAKIRADIFDYIKTRGLFGVNPDGEMPKVELVASDHMRADGLDSEVMADQPKSELIAAINNTYNQVRVNVLPDLLK